MTTCGGMGKPAAWTKSSVFSMVAMHRHNFTDKGSRSMPNLLVFGNVILYFSVLSTKHKPHADSRVLLPGNTKIL